ncbi:Adenylate cyclase [hydrothermal vent metagenome]|uniref:Adenylate cyclase n=1 Tax=hydrothermal vent metagenome TaxID=652676 RepID=A0A3B0YXC0_9ZZZZ
MPAWIQIEGKQQKYPMPHANNFCIGRNDDCDLQLDDPKASRNHAIVQHNGGIYYLIDIASKNGCYLNNSRISSPCTLKNGDQIRIGDTSFIFGMDDTDNTNDDMEKTMLIAKEIEPNVKEITILVADIRSFTALTESLSIQDLSVIMNQWFSDVTDCVEEHDGILDKFIGDSVYARWNTQAGKTSPVELALKTSCALNKISININKKFPDIPFPLNIGIGINTGHAAMDIGAEGTAMGDAVNLAFRLEDQSKIIGKNIVMSETSWKHLNNAQWDDDNHAMKIFVKGKKDSVNIIGINFNEASQYLDSI